MRCPFGCRQQHRRRRSSQRSTAYYQTAIGKVKKKRLNARRQGGQVLPPAQPQGTPPDEHTSDPWPVTAGLQLEEAVLGESSLASSPMLPYVRMVVSLIEGVELSRHEVLGLLQRTMRQHSIGAGSRSDYVLSLLHQHPP